MKTNRDEILQSALQLFMWKNYEAVSLQMITKQVGLTKTGIFNYFPTKMDVFVAVVDTFLFNAQNPQNKFDASNGSLYDFLDKYIAGVKRTMETIVRIGNVDKDAMPGKSANSGYFHLIQQVLFYYPNGKEKLNQLFENEHTLWTSVLRHAVEIGEIKEDTDIEAAFTSFYYGFMGLSYVSSFYDGLDTETLDKHFKHIYAMLKK
ncbi:TetR/AcrR family transcriptional regulator [uncultured Bacteroides sp.]|uniref:TetR/AcrR family transcriptional regulator n=1 Tax=uncultured Bacteroides sp. TaxID=162156 RepID=UPI002621C0A1|nr:helix-turn-helix domain-containing protein [uncultured Bacteroides sp.]